MAFVLLAWLSNPTTWMMAMIFVATASRVVRKAFADPQDQSRVIRTASSGSEAVATALMFLSTAYRPSVDFVAKAQIQEQEDADGDDCGGPDSPKRHFQRQLSRIRNGDRVDRLVWRLQ